MRERILRARRCRIRAWLALVPLVACAPGDVVTPEDGVRGLVDPAGGFWALPLPATHRAPDGRTSLEAFPNPDDAPFLDVLLGAASAVHGAPLSAAITLPLDGPAALADVPLAETIVRGAPVMLVDVDPASPERGRRVPVQAVVREGGRFGPTWAVVLLPLQGVPLRPNTRYAAAVAAEALDGATPAWLDTLRAGGAPEGWAAADVVAWSAALDTLVALGEPTDLAAMTVLETGDPTAELPVYLDAARAAGGLAWVQHPSILEAYDGFCVLEGRVSAPVFQGGLAPYTGGGGGFVAVDGVPAVQRWEEARVFVTLPEDRGEALDAVVFVRTGGGGDRPLIDRGPRAVGGVDVTGTGYAGVFAAAGYAGVQVDGPLGGLRNPTGGDEQLLVFNVANPVAMRDNLRQSALELALVPDLLDGLSLDPSGCPGASAPVRLRHDAVTLFGHSMGATIGPVAVAVQPAYRSLVLSGAGGSWIHNVVSKQKPLPVRPIAAAILGEDPDDLDPFHPALSLLQWAGEAADPPLFGPALVAAGTQVLMVQGLVDHYILPDIANATTLSHGLDLGGPALDAAAVPEMIGVRELLPLVGGAARALPVSGNAAGGARTAVVVQLAEDGVEDGHEVAFQRADARATVGCFLETMRGGVPVVMDPAQGCPGDRP